MRRRARERRESGLREFSRVSSKSCECITSTVLSMPPLLVPVPVCTVSVPTRSLHGPVSRRNSLESPCLPAMLRATARHTLQHAHNRTLPMSTPAKRTRMLAAHLEHRNAHSQHPQPIAHNDKVSITRTRTAQSHELIRGLVGAQPVVVEAHNAMRKLVLNRPKALNSLNEEMIDLIQSNLTVRNPSTTRRRGRDGRADPPHLSQLAPSTRRNSKRASWPT